MKSNIFTIVLFVITIFLLGSVSLPHVVVDDANTFRVMTFNLRLDTPSDGENAWPHRKENVARIMRFHKTDFVGIQEGLPHQLEQLDEMLPEFDRIGVGRNGGGDEGEYSAIFYNKERFELLDNNTFWLSETPNEAGSMGWDAAFPRIVTWGKFRDTNSDKTFFMFNTHFDHQGFTARAESASLILKKIAEIAEGEPVVLTGDFNTTEKDPPYEILTGELGEHEVVLEDAYYHAKYGHLGPTSTWNGFDQIVPDRRIDFIFTNPGFEVVQHATIADQQDGHFPSDHLPVAADIQFAE